MAAGLGSGNAMLFLIKLQCGSDFLDNGAYVRLPYFQLCIAYLY